MTMPPDDRLDQLRQRVFDTIPVSRAMQPQWGPWDGTTLTLRAPLAPNINDKGCAFGGSLTSLMTLAGWGLISLHLAAHGHAGDVFVGHSETAYLAPAWQDFEIVARFAADADPDRFLSTLSARGKARIDITCETREHAGAVTCATLHARFVARRTESD